MKKAYINAFSLRTVCGDTDNTLKSIFEKKSFLKVHDDIIKTKDICIGKFQQSSNFQKLLEDSVNEVLKKSNLSNYSNTILLVGSSVGGMATTENTIFKDKSYQNIDISKHTINTISAFLDNKFNFKSTRSFSTACTSSANAIKTAKELIEIGAYDNALVVGADEICHTTIFGFNSLGILSDEISTPFQKNRKGMNVAEGIGALLIQSTLEKDSIEVVGAGTSSDAYHIANPDPKAGGAITAMNNALKNANLSFKDIDYINAHGTGTQANDEVEAKAIQNIFINNIYVSSSKSNIGHTLGAAGAIEAILCVESLKQQLLIPQVFTENNETSIKFVAKAEKIKLRYSLSNSFAFGGNNTSLIFSACNEN